MLRFLLMLFGVVLWMPHEQRVYDIEYGRCDYTRVTEMVLSTPPYDKIRIVEHVVVRFDDFGRKEVADIKRESNMGGFIISESIKMVSVGSDTYTINLGTNVVGKSHRRLETVLEGIMDQKYGRSATKDVTVVEDTVILGKVCTRYLVKTKESVIREFAAYGQKDEETERIALWNNIVMDHYRKWVNPASTDVITLKMTRLEQIRPDPLIFEVPVM
ncbi:MAG: hypothetical protein EOM61_05260 [Bacteroidia bacterium]|nr:hypothetical protein [Bacteroidia bacterium]